jgi:AraC-like DNA-binding protein
MDINTYFQTEGNSGNLMLILFLHTSPLNLLLGPFLYFYVRSTLTDYNRLSIKDLLHFIPFVLITIDIIPYFQLPVEEKREIIQLISNDMNAIRIYARGHILNHYQYTLVRWSSWFGYLLFILYSLLKNRPEKIARSSHSKSQYRLIYTWLLTLTLSFLAALLPTIFIIQNFHSGKLDMNGYEYLSMPAFVFSMAIYVLACLSILLYPQILYGLPQLAPPTSNDNVTSAVIQDMLLPASTTQRPLQIPTKNDLDEDPLSTLAASIERYIYDEKAYLNPDFSIYAISHRLQVPQHHIHYCFSKIIRCGFPAYRNRLRVMYAKELLADGHGRKLTIDAIGKQAGFSAKMNFYTAFKKETGLTPKQYLDSLRKDP